MRKLLLAVPMFLLVRGYGPKRRRLPQPHERFESDFILILFSSFVSPAMKFFSKLLGRSPRRACDDLATRAARIPADAEVERLKLLLAAARREQYGSERWRWLREQLALEELDARVCELDAYSFRSARPEQKSHCRPRRASQDWRSALTAPSRASLPSPPAPSQWRRAESIVAAK